MFFTRYVGSNPASTANGRVPQVVRGLDEIYGV